MTVLNLTTGQTLADKVAVADSLFSRMKGLLGKKYMSAGEGLWLKPCNSVHTFGMKFAIDVVFLDKNNHVVSFVKNLVPNSLTSLRLKATSVLELPAGTLDSLTIAAGDELKIV